jgi:hypothetical protein
LHTRVTEGKTEGKIEGREDEKEEAGSYWKTFREREDIENE